MADYFINEGNKIGYMPTEFGTDGNGGTTLEEKKLVAGEAIKKGQLVMVSDAWTVSVCTAAGNANCIGVAMFDAAKDKPVVVHTNGLFKVTAGGSITAPAQLTSGADGKVVTASSGDKVVGIALNDAAAAGDPVYVRFNA